LGGRREWGATERAAQVEAKLEARKQEVSYLPQRRRHRGGRTPIIGTVAGTGRWSPPLSLFLSVLSFSRVYIGMNGASFEKETDRIASLLGQTQHDSRLSCPEEGSRRSSVVQPSASEDF
jgi:hypothetical protein